MITKKEVRHIAKLARLGLTETEIKKYQKELSSILEYIEKLKKLHVSKTESFLLKKKREMRFPIIGRENIMRADESKKSEIKPKRLLDLAPETKNGFLKVKSILK